MELEITITDTKHRFIHYENEPLMARITSENRPLHISTKLINIFEQLPCGNPKNNWEDKKLSTITIKIQQSLTKLYHHPYLMTIYFINAMSLAMTPTKLNKLKLKMQNNII